MIKHINIKIRGQVQGVNFRYYAKQKAEELGLSGWVANMSEGAVYVEAEGEEAGLLKLVQWCERGPNWASVERVEHNFGSMKNFSDFEIK